MTGTAAQIEWAARIRKSVESEFTRVARAFTEAAVSQSDQDRVDTQAILGVLEEKRMDVLAKDDAGYFIREWQELRDQVRQLIARDPRYRAIRSRREARNQESRSK